MGKLIYFLAVLFGLGSLCGCSSSRTFLDDYMMLGGTSLTQVDEYFELNDQQRKNLDQEVAKDFDRLRRERFVKIAALLRRFDREAAGNSKLLSQAFVDLQKEYKIDNAYFRTSAGKFISTLPREQISKFNKRVATELKQKADLKQAQKRDDELRARYLQALEFWAGDLSESQQRHLTQFMQKNPFPWAEKIRNSEFIWTHFKRLQKNDKKLRKFSEDFVANYDSLRLGEYAVALADYERRFQVFLDVLWGDFDQGQKERLHRNLLSRAEKLEELAARPWEWK